MNKSSLIFGVLFMSLLGAAKADDTLTLDPTTGNYILTHNGAQSVWVPGTKFTPTIQSWFQARENGAVTYRYRLKNGKDSQQTIHGIRIMLASGASNATAPTGWGMTNFPSWRSTSWAGLTWSISLIHGDSDKIGLAPGRSLEGMSVSGMFLPEVAVAEMWRIAKESFELNGTTEEESGNELSDFDTPAFEQLNNLMAHNYVTRYIATPAIAIPNPFDPAAALTKVQNHIDQDLINFRLVDPTFATQLDRLLQAAVAAAKGGNTVALKSNIKDLHRLLKREHAGVDTDDEDIDKNDDDGKEKNKSHLIDRLAARVLDFDLRYVERRLRDKENKDKDD